MTDRRELRRDSELEKQRQASACPNTYRLQPKNNGIFSSIKVKPTLETVLESNLSEYKYNASTSGELCKQLADECKQKLKLLGYKRYKFVSQCVIFSDTNQTVRFVSRSLWDDKLDNFVTATYKGDGFEGVLMVGAVYFE